MTVTHLPGERSPTLPSNTEKQLPAAWYPLLALAAYAFAVSVVFRDSIASGFDLGFGDRADALIEISILEHWRAVLLGEATWNQPLYFHPYAGTLGYNDGYFLSGLIYTGWRSVFDPFVSDTLTALTYKTIGYAATLWLVRGILRWSWGVAILIATLAMISNNMFLQSVHAQIQTLALLPVVAALAVLTARAEIAREQWRAALLAVLAAAALGLWLITAFYFAWFTIYFAVALAVCWLWSTGQWRLNSFMLLTRTHWRTLGVFIGASVIAAFPFLYVYVPKRMETGGHGFMISYTVQPTDLINVGQHNLLWGWIIQLLDWVVRAVAPAGGRLERAMLGGEHESGFPLLLFALICAAAVKLIRQRDAGSFAGIFALAIAISWFLTLRIWQVSPWVLVHFLVPAASGVRVVLRYQLFLILPALLLVGLAFRDDLAQLWRSRPWLASVLVGVLLAEQINLAQPAQLSRQEQTAALDAIPAPPLDCKSFYVVAARAKETVFVDQRLNALYPHNVDAMFLAARWQLPTINGFSTFNPPDWNFAAPAAADFDARVLAYAEKHELKDLCRLDMRNAAPWTRIDVKPGRLITPVREADRYTSKDEGQRSLVG